jgi:DNA-directed RNA polymerase subunit H (RpoH/RPB5)
MSLDSSLKLYSRVYDNIVTYITEVRKHKLENKHIDLKIESTVGFIPITSTKNNHKLCVVLITSNGFITKSTEFNSILKKIKKVNELIIVSSVCIKLHTMSTILKNNPNLNIRSLDFSYFKNDPRKHIMVPRHVLVNTEEGINNTLKQYNVAVKLQLPAIKYNDIQVVWLNGNIGDLVQIYRIDDNGYSNTCRVVV